MDILRDIRIAGKNTAVERSINLSITDRLAEASDESHAYRENQTSGAKRCL